MIVIVDHSVVGKDAREDISGEGLVYFARMNPFTDQPREKPELNRSTGRILKALVSDPNDT